MFDIAGAIKGVAELTDDLWTSDEEEMGMLIQSQKIDAGLAQGQMVVNAKEAEHKSVFVAGWRPFIGWVGGSSLAYNFLVYPMICWGFVIAKAKGWVPDGIEAPPLVDTSQLYPLIFGMLGLGTMRTVEGLKGKKTQAIAPVSKEKKKGWWPW